MPQLPSFQAGDKVRVLGDKQLVQNLQQGHGGWNESMTAVRHVYLDVLVSNEIIFRRSKRKNRILCWFFFFPLATAGLKQTKNKSRTSYFNSEAREA